MAEDAHSTNQHEAGLVATSRAGVQGRVQLKKDVKHFTQGALMDIRKETVQTARIAAMLAEASGKDTIWNTPSSLSSQPKDNRVWTGKMVEAYSSDVGLNSKNSITIRWGWVKKKARYFLTQEYGGHAFGKNVTPMFALATSKIVVEDYLKSKGIS